MALTITETINAVVSMNIPGVKAIREAPPPSVSSAMLPLGYIRNCTIGHDARTLNLAGAGTIVTCELVILVDASRQGTVEDLYRETREIMDSLATTLLENSANLRLDDFSIKEDFEAVEVNSYFVVSSVIVCS
jgi:hypothetical protein